MKLTLFVATALAATVAVAADKSTQVTFTKADSALGRVKCEESYNKGAVCWRGQVTIEGKLIVEFDRASVGKGVSDSKGRAFFEPSPDSAKKLPAAMDYYPAPVSVVWLHTRPRDILVPLVEAKKTNAIISGASPRYELPVTLTLSMFVADIDCDHRSYGLKYSAIRPLLSEVAVLNQAKHLGC